MTDVLNPRRASRVPFRCSVEIRYGLLSWRAETEDLGPTGCQIITSRIVSRRRELKLTFRAEELGMKPITVKGTVMWARPDSPSRIGVRFDADTDTTWFETLLAADPTIASEAVRIPEKLSPDTRIYLGLPPRRRLQFSNEELAVLRAASGGSTLEQLARATGPDFEKARGRLFSLIGRRMVVLEPAEAVSAERWRLILGEVIGARRATPVDGTPDLHLVRTAGPTGA